MKGPATFRKWLAARGISQAAAARVFGVSPPSFHGWIHGNKCPQHHYRAAIERWTGGAVAARDWATAAEAGELDRLEAIQPHGGPRV